MHVQDGSVGTSPATTVNRKSCDTFGRIDGGRGIRACLGTSSQHYTSEYSIIRNDPGSRPCGFWLVDLLIVAPLLLPQGSSGGPMIGVPEIKNKTEIYRTDKAQ